MKLFGLDDIYLNKKSIIYATSLLNKYKRNEPINVRKVFEYKLKKYLGVNHVFACTSGTNGLRIALLSLGIKKGDEVITNPVNYNMGTISSILTCGAKPILAKITKDGFMDVNDIGRKINSKTRAILAVHLNGFLEDLITLEKIKNKYGLFIVEDACQALGSKINIKNKWEMAGAIGDIGVFSFSPHKFITAIGGGAVVTNNNSLVPRIRTFLSNHNSKLDHLRSVIGLGNFESINSLISERKRKWLKYEKSLKNYRWLRIMRPNKNQIINYTSFGMCIDNEKIRAKLARLLLSAGYDVNQGRKGDKLNKFVEYSATSEIKADIRNFTNDKVSLPTHPGVNEKSIKKIVGCFENINAKVKNPRGHE